MKFREACRFGYEKYTSSFSLNTIQNLRNSFTLKCKPLSSAIAAHLVACSPTQIATGATITMAGVFKFHLCPSLL
jgi:hypothetical protein